MKNNKLLLSLVLIVSIVLVFFYNKKSDINSNIENVATNESPLKSNVNSTNFDFLPTSTSNQIVRHNYYTLSYKEEYEEAEWVAYFLQSNKKSNHFDRPFFIEDSKVKTQSADWRNYKNSGYDKGHLCPAGDMAFSKNAYDDTFFTSNISPQLHHFNDGVWNRLEQKVRYWSSKYDGIYVVTGGVLTQNLKTIGKEKVAVPNYFYKVLLNISNGKSKMIAFLVPHRESENPLYEFVVSVDKVEQMTGIDFFPKLDDGLENQLEKSSDYKGWSF